MPQCSGTCSAASDRLYQHPFGAATMVYAASVFGLLLYAYFEPRDLV